MNLPDMKKCTGCSACAAVCTRNCIKMTIGENGFMHPQVDIENCIDCGACMKKCHVLNPPKEIECEKSFYCGYDFSEDKRFEGSSGGAFGAIAESIIAKGGVVYGAIFSEDKKKLFHCSSEAASLQDMKKSKYLESEIGNTIRDIQENLRKEKNVLFCGTPCQVYGMRKVFGYKYNSLLLIDFLCHGVPSQISYRNYIDELETIYGSRVVNVGFRTKKYGWKTYCIEVEFENGEKYIRLAKEDPYYKRFFSNMNLRSSCYTCNRAANSVADITLGDFWLARKMGYTDDDKGISLIVCNSDIGKKSIEHLTTLKLKKIQYSDIAYAYLKRNTKENKNHENGLFFKDFKISTKDKIVCTALRYKFLRGIIYKIKLYDN